ncbi:MAG: family N-acetyltransferase [Chitinophagaceae bacterium]|jgi:RimJ/RimL family protein N-acetyltransferase|nr:family N-acetyltransferase [Chitinophagaceae bacterium]
MLFQFDKEYILEDERVLLRPLTKEDSINLQYFSLNEPDLWRFSLQSAAGRENLEKYIDIAVKAKASQKEYPFIVFDKKTGKYAGSTRFYDIIPEFQSLQLGYTWYGKQFQGTGLNRHCKYLLFGFVFEELGAERLELRADNDNARSIAAMKSIGCKVDGILRANMPKPEGQPGRRDSIVLSVLKNEWFGEVKALLASKLASQTS